MEGISKLGGDSHPTDAVGTMFFTFFNETKPVGWNTVKGMDKVKVGKFFLKMLANGIYVAPPQFKAGLISTPPTTEMIDRTIETVRRRFAHGNHCEDLQGHMNALWYGMCIDLVGQPEKWMDSVPLYLVGGLSGVVITRAITLLFSKTE